MPSADWFEASDLWRWQQENEPDHIPMDTIEDTTTSAPVAPAAVITAEQVRAYMEGHIRALGAKAPGYVTVECEATWLRPGNSKPNVRFQAYCEHIGHSNLCDTPEEAIDQVVAKVDGRSEAVILREKAAKLLSDADAAEALAKQAEGEVPA